MYAGHSIEHQQCRLILVVSASSVEIQAELIYQVQISKVRVVYGLFLFLIVRRIYCVFFVMMVTISVL